MTDDFKGGLIDDDDNQASFLILLFSLLNRLFCEVKDSSEYLFG